MKKMINGRLEKLKKQIKFLTKPDHLKSDGDLVRWKTRTINALYSEIAELEKHKKEMKGRM